MKARAAVGPWFIFQFAAKTGRRISGVICSSSAATPGSVLPSRNSSDAPPPVDTWLILLVESGLLPPPPPSRRRRRSSSRPALVALAIASAIARVPSSNGGVSNTPIGPFQSTVFADAIARAYDSAVRGPMSNIASSAGIASRATACAALRLRRSTARPSRRAAG